MRDITENPVTRLSTEALAARFMVKPNTIRSALTRTGHYFNWRPEKLPNGRLAWVERR